MWFDDIHKSFTNPYDKSNNFYMCIERIGRYFYCRDFFEKYNIKKVLDIGSGTGFGCEIISETAEMVDGIECHKKYFSPSIRNAQRKNIQNINYSYCDYYADEFEFPSKNYDFVICFDRLAAMPNQMRFLRKVYDCVADGGYIFVAVPNVACEPLNPDGTIAIEKHINTYTKDEIVQLITEAGFKVLDVYGQPLTNILFNKEYTLINKFDLNERTVKDYYKYTKTNLHYYARLLAYPTTTQLELSYNYFVLATKI